MRHYLRGCGMHRTLGDNSGGRLGFQNNGHPGGIPWGCGIQDGVWYTLSYTVFAYLATYGPNRICNVRSCLVSKPHQTPYQPPERPVAYRFKRELDTMHMEEGQDPLDYLGKVDKTADELAMLECGKIDEEVNQHIL